MKNIKLGLTLKEALHGTGINLLIFFPLKMNDFQLIIFSFDKIARDRKSFVQIWTVLVILK